MLRKPFSAALWAATAAVLVWTAGSASAAGRGGGGGHGGGGGFHGGYGGGYHGGYGGYGHGYGGYGRGYGGFGYGGYGGYGYYPGYYGRSYYSPYASNYGYVVPDYAYGVVPDVGTDFSPTTSDAATVEDSAGPATIQLTVPSEAQVWFDGKKTRQTGSIRRFTSPTLTGGKEYTYDLRVRFMGDNGPVERERTVTVRPNQTTSVDFTTLRTVARDR